MKLGNEGHFLNKNSSQEDMLKVNLSSRASMWTVCDRQFRVPHISMLIINGAYILGPVKSLLVNFE